MSHYKTALEQIAKNDPSMVSSAGIIAAAALAKPIDHQTDELTLRLAQNVRMLMDALLACNAPKDVKRQALNAIDAATLTLKEAGIGRTLVYERLCTKWHVRVYRNTNGMAIIERVRGPIGLDPMTWDALRTPEEWLNTQPANHRPLYVRVAP